MSITDNDESREIAGVAVRSMPTVQSGAMAEVLRIDPLGGNGLISWSAQCGYLTSVTLQDLEDRSDRAAEKGIDNSDT
jgi:hypothetical protein